MNKVKLGEILEITSSKRIHAEDYVETGIPFYRSKEVIQLGKGEKISEVLHISNEQYSKIKSKFPVPVIGDILLTSVGTIGIPYYVTDANFYFKDGNLTWFRKFDDSINSKYLLFWMKSKFFKNQINNNNIGAVQKALTIDFLKKFEIKVPPLDTQKKVVHVLSALDSKIELNNLINAELEAMAKTLYDYWFVQFDFPDKNGKPYKTSGGKMVWNEELKREIPEGWEVKLLGSEIEIQRGISYTSKEINGDGIPMISLNSFNLDGTYKPEGIKKYSGKYTDKNITLPGDLLIAATDVTRNADIIGRAILVPDYYSEDLVFSMDIAKIISKNIPSSFLMMLFNSNHYHNYIKWYASGTIVLHLNLDGTKRYNIEMPPKELLQKYDALYQPIAQRIYKTAIENQKLTELRDWLLPMLMNGQVKVT